MKTLKIKVKYKKKPRYYTNVKFYSKSKFFLEITFEGKPDTNNSTLPIKKRTEIKLTEILSIEESVVV